VSGLDFPGGKIKAVHTPSSAAGGSEGDAVFGARCKRVVGCGDCGLNEGAERRLEV
jgi:hypothetical protein